MKSRERKYVRVRQHSGWCCALAAMIVVMGAAQTYAQCVEVQKLTASDAGVGNAFGVSVSVSGDTAVVGASGDGCATGAACGSAYVFRFDGSSWVEEQKLTASDTDIKDFFGQSVFVSGETALVGAAFNDCAAGKWCGAAYVFRFDGMSWVEQQKLVASDAGTHNHFGRSVTVSGDTAVVGASLDDCAAGFGCGSAYVFRFVGTSRVEEQKLTASDAAAFDFFGATVSVSGDKVLVGKHGDDCAGGDLCGSAYIFRFDGASWVEEQKLIASEVAAPARFGSSVSLSGDTAVVGASRTDCATGADCGLAYVFRFNGESWVEDRKLTASDAAANDRFGGSITVSGETVIVGATGNNCEAGVVCGSAYVFSCTSLVSVVNLDIKPGTCPNPVNPKSKGVVPVAIVGSCDFDVTTTIWTR